AADDHRNFNRHGEAFDMGETFSGVDYNVGLEAVDEMRALVPAGVSMSQFALRWIVMFDAVTCAIPGGKRAEQVANNCRASDLPPLTAEAMTAVRRIYDKKIRSLGQDLWDTDYEGGRAMIRQSFLIWRGCEAEQQPFGSFRLLGRTLGAIGDVSEIIIANTGGSARLILKNLFAAAPHQLPGRKNPRRRHLLRLQPSQHKNSFTFWVLF